MGIGTGTEIATRIVEGRTMIAGGTGTMMIRPRSDVAVAAAMMTKTTEGCAAGAIATVGAAETRGAATMT
jgi:hypothetical protein